MTNKNLLLKSNQIIAKLRTRHKRSTQVKTGKLSYGEMILPTSVSASISGDLTQRRDSAAAESISFTFRLVLHEALKRIKNWKEEAHPLKF